MVFRIEGASIRDAMAAIERGSANAAFAVDAEQTLVGVITDGDIRRALLGGWNMNAPVAHLIQKSPVVARVDESRSALLDLMQSRGISQVPVLDNEGRIVAVHLLKELIGKISRPNLAVVLAGGRGVRLRPITDSTPKPMVSVAGRPILERLVNHLVGYGISNIILSVGYRAEVVEAHFGDGASFGCRISYVREDASAPLGTGGPLALVHRAHAEAQHPVLVLNGDLVTHFDVASIMAHHSAVGAVATIGTRTYSHEVPFGVLDVDAGGWVQAIMEKPKRVERVSAGIYVLDPTVLATVPLGVFTPITQVLARCIDEGQRVATWTLEQDWMDVGHPQDLAVARGSQT